MQARQYNLLGIFFNPTQPGYYYCDGYVLKLSSQKENNFSVQIL